MKKVEQINNSFVKFSQVTNFSKNLTIEMIVLIGERLKKFVQKATNKQFFHQIFHSVPQTTNFLQV